MGGQRLVDIADPRNFLQIGIHLLVARYGKEFALLQSVVFILFQQPDRMCQQRNTAHDGRFLAGLVNPLGTLFIYRDMFFPQMFYIRKRQPCQTAEREHVPDTLQAIVRHRLSDKRLQFVLCQMVFVLVVLLLEFVVSERVFLNPLVPNGIAREILHAVQQVDRPVVVTVMRRLYECIETIDKLVIDRSQWYVFLTVLRRNILLQVTQYR